MSAFQGPFGLRPAYHMTGGTLVRNQDQIPIASGLATNIFQGSPVAIVAASGTLALAAAGSRATGAFQGVEYTLTADGRRHVGNMWPASSVATDIVAYYSRDPYVIYEIQANAAMAADDIGETFDWSTNGSANGNTVTGVSTVSLDIASAASPAGLQVVGLAPYVDNGWTDAFPIVYVRILEHQFLADSTAF